jgi:ABC-2 type transport system ATP-binding protein
MTDRAAIEAVDVHKSFGEVKALSGLTFRVERGSITALLGPNGAGKTTAIRLMLNLAAQDRGSLSVLGMDTRQHSLLIRRRVGYVPENRAFTPGFTVKRVLELFQGISETWDKKLENRLLSDFNLPPTRKVRELSRGMTGQLALILALSPRPDLLILDEPVSGLDPVMRREFMRNILAEVADRGQTVLLSSHTLSEVERTADTVVLMNHGKAILAGSMEHIKNTEKKVRVAPQGGLPPEVRNHPAVISVRSEGRAFLLTVSGDTEDLLAQIHRHNPFAVEVLDLSLEDIFLARSEGDEQ